MPSDTQRNFPLSNTVQLSDLTIGETLSVQVVPGREDLVALAKYLDIIAVSKLRLDASLILHRDGSVDLSGRLGASVTQPCVISLAPVKTRIDEPVERRYVPHLSAPDDDHQMADDEDIVEPLSNPIDLGAVLVEHLALALPPFPRAENASLSARQFTEPGQTPMSDDDAKPFAGLAELLDKHKDPGKS